MTSSVGSSTNTSFNYSALNKTLSGSGTASGSSAINDQQNQFLTLLVTQLQDQDPTNPVDSAQTTSQMAEISTVTSLQQLNASMQTMLSSLNSSQSLQAASIIGKAVLAPSSTGKVSYDGTNDVASSVDVPAGITSMTVNILDSKGNVVDSSTGTPTAGQLNALDWDGTNSTGTKVASGTYTIQATGIDSTGSQVKLTVDNWATASSVVLNSSGAQVTLGDGSTVNLSDIKQIA